jgi:chromosomal replication initiation ATPase DnaA
MTSRFFPFHDLGFRCNPFRALTREEWSQIAVVPQAIEEAIEGDFSHLQIIGNQGSGKTSALLALKKRFKDQGHKVQYCYLPPGQTKLPGTWPVGEILLIDEMQRLTQNQRLRVVKKVAPMREAGLRLIFSSHEDLSPVFARLRRPLQTIPLHHHEAEFVRSVIERRLRFFSEGDSARASLTEEAYGWLGETFADDLRSLEDFLYEVFQRRQFESVISVEVLRRAMAQ